MAHIELTMALVILFDCGPGRLLVGEGYWQLPFGYGGTSSHLSSGGLPY